MTGGIAVGDFDNDGWEDIFVARFDQPDVLLHNDGGVFSDVTPLIMRNSPSWGSNGAVWYARCAADAQA